MLARGVQAAMAGYGLTVRDFALSLLCLPLGIALIMATYTITDQVSGAQFWQRAVATDIGMLILAGIMFLTLQRHKMIGAILFTLLGAAYFTAVQLKYNLIYAWPVVHDLYLIDEAIEHQGRWAPVVIGAAVIAWTATFLWNFKRQIDAPLLCTGLALTVINVGLSAFPRTSRAFLEEVHHHSELHGNSFLQKGILFSSLWEIANYRTTQAQLARLQSDLQLPDTPYVALGALPKVRNVHIIVLESFMDPTDLGLWTSQPAIPEAFRSLWGGKMLVPVYGGGTAQTEFEILCGLPAISLIEENVFASLDGNPVDCLPHLLRQRGYQTVAWAANPPHIFNAEKAYRSLGFSVRFYQNHFLDQFDHGPDQGHESAAETSANDWHLSDRVLFATIRQQLGELIKAGQPLLTYTLTIAGHQPYHLHPEWEPLVVETSGPEIMTKMVNRLRYSAEQALQHIQWLLKADPDAVILVAGDHQGSKFEFEKEWRAGFRSTPALPKELIPYAVPFVLIDAGVVRRPGITPSYQLNRLLAETLAGTSPQHSPGLDFRPIGDKTHLVTAHGDRICPDVKRNNVKRNNVKRSNAKRSNAKRSKLDDLCTHAAGFRRMVTAHLLRLRKMSRSE